MVQGLTFSNTCVWMASGLIVTVRHSGMWQPFLGWLRSEKKRNAKFPHSGSLKKKKKTLIGSPWGLWHWHPSIILAVVSIPRWLQLACFSATQAKPECVALIPFPAGSVTEARSFQRFVSYCILPLLGRSPSLTVVYNVSAVSWAQCK